MEKALLERAGFEVAATGEECPVALKQSYCFFKLLLMTKMVILFIAIACLQARAAGQNISLSFKNAALEKVFASIEQQSGYHFIYTKEEMATAKPVTISITNASITTVLDLCFKEQPVTYKVQDKYVIVKENKVQGNKAQEGKGQEGNKAQGNKVQGKVVDEEGKPISGATITIKGTKIGAASGDKGEFEINFEGDYSRIVVTSIGFETQEVYFQGKSFLNIILQRAINSLDETLVIAYGHTTRRLNTGSISTVNAKEISKQPVSNPLAALQGRVPGLIVTQTSGVTGSAFNIELRGRTSLDMTLSKNDPLIIIDGVPFEAGNRPSNQLSSAVNNPMQISEGGMSPLNVLNPSEIENITVLKDADATAIYGSRGANGVILITTKKGVTGKTKASAGFYSGFSKVTRSMDMLNTQQYVAMRREAFMNDGITPTITNAPDIMLWDTTRNTDIKKLLIGGSAYSTDAQFSLSGGNNLTNFFIGGGYHYETNVFSRKLADKRGSLRFNISHASANQKLHITLSGSFASDKNNLVRTDLTSFLRLTPNVQLLDSSGNINWQEKGINLPTENPYAVLEKKYSSLNENLQGNLQVEYKATKALTVRLNAGFNLFNSDETLIQPKTSIAPTSNSLATSSFGKANNRNWIIEPQAEYSKSFKKVRVSILAGSSFQEKIYNSESINATNYTNDLLLYSMSAAGNITANNNYFQYRYEGVFGRLNVTGNQKYILNISGRRDGSSRFGPGKRFANFGAAGIGWIFCDEAFIKKGLPFLSFGKLRGSYGVTGNDQIGEYKYLDLWTNTSVTYQGLPGLRPNSLFNPDYNWERNKKLEAAIELGFIKDHILISAAYYRNRSNNQLINYKLAMQTGFTSITRNFDALVQNSGFEFTASSKNIVSQHIRWTTAITLTIPQNKLFAFPGLAGSSYANSYVIGQPLSIIKRFKYTGIDPATGIYQFEDVNRDGFLTGVDFQSLGNLEPKYYGGIQNDFAIKGFQLGFFIEFRKQTGRNYLYQQAYNFPGGFNNQPVIVLDRWRQAGDITGVQKFTSNANGPAGSQSGDYLSSSNGIYGDASFIRLKNVSLSYDVTDKILKRIYCESMQLYIHAQNLLTITNYKGSDPETQNLYQLPPLKTIVFGAYLNF